MGSRTGNSGKPEDELCCRSLMSGERGSVSEVIDGAHSKNTNWVSTQGGLVLQRELIQAFESPWNGDCEPRAGL